MHIFDHHKSLAFIVSLILFSTTGCLRHMKVNELIKKLPAETHEIF